MDLKRLGHLVALADERHFARAAERVHLSQPAFSRSIQAIEGEAGMRLFDRDAGGVKPTPAGTFLIERARRLLFDARSLQRDVHMYRDSELGDTAFGAGPFPAATLMPHALPELRKRHPGVGLRVEVSNWKQLLQRLIAEDIEFFVSEVRDLPRDPRIAVHSLGRQHGRFYVRAGHPLAGHACTLARAWRFGVAATKLPDALRALLVRRLGLPGEGLALALECDDFALLRAIALSTDTVMAATDAAVRSDVRAGLLVEVTVKDFPDAYSEMGIVTLRDRTPSPMARRAMDCIEKVTAEVNRPRPSRAALPGKSGKRRRA